MRHPAVSPFQRLFSVTLSSVLLRKTGLDTRKSSLKKNEYVGWSCGFSLWYFVQHVLVVYIMLQTTDLFCSCCFYEVSDVIYGIGLATVVYMAVQFLRGIAGTFFSSAPNLKKCVCPPKHNVPSAFLASLLGSLCVSSVVLIISWEGLG